jgi:hypothetical protein
MEAGDGHKKSKRRGPFEAKLKSRGSTGGMHFPLRYRLWRLGVLAKNTEYRFRAQGFDTYRSEQAASRQFRIEPAMCPPAIQLSDGGRDSFAPRPDKDLDSSF